MTIVIVTKNIIQQRQTKETRIDNTLAKKINSGF